MNKDIKIGFYFKNNKYENIDFSSPQNGNPGVGGVEYMFSLVSYYCANLFETYVFANHTNNLSDKTNNITVNSLEDTLKKADELNINYLVCRSLGNEDDYKLLNKYNCKIIIWAHNFSKLKELNWISSNRNIVKYVCVGKNQFDLLNGHKIYKKTTYIYNGLPLEAYKYENKETNKSICYIGSIIKGKGFDKCCKVWRKLYDNNIKVDFNIIGSARLYNSKKKLGKYGIALEEYEKEFIKYLIDNNDNLLKEVKLFGIQSHLDKVDTINSSYLGISASQEETFGLIALEFAALGKPFVALNTLGYDDVVKNGETGILVYNEEDLYKALLLMLNKDVDEYNKMSNKCVERSKTFDISEIMNDWQLLIEGLESNKDSLNRSKDIPIIKKISNLINLAINYR